MNTPPPAPVARYGEHPDQVANLHLPRGDGAPWPCVVLIHGGFWRARWDRTLMTPLAIDLARRGIAAWNIEYRRVGQEGGGWPGTFEDVAAGIDSLADAAEIDPQRVVTCGHSAGGHLALWLATRDRLPAGAPGDPARVLPRAVVSQAGVCDLVAAYEAGLGAGAVGELLGGNPTELPERYHVASPVGWAPLGIPQLLIHGDADEIVPPRQSELHAARDPRATLLLVSGADHFDVIAPDHEAWNRATSWIEEVLQ